MDESNRRIVILGKTGVGKSSLANTIFGTKRFKIDDTANSGTRKCEAKTKSVNGRRITLIDTPGLFDTDRSKDELKTEIMRCITECAPGPHAFLIVLEVNKFTEQEQAVINRINEYFSEEAFRYATVVFTRGDQLPEGQTIEGFVHQNKLLSDLVEKCGGRCHVIDNRYWEKKSNREYRSNKFQVEELLKTIDKMVRENNGSCYTNEVLQAVEEEIQQEGKNIRQSAGNMSEREIRKQAKVKVFRNFSVRLAGIGTGVLVGALCGVAVSVGIVLAAVNAVSAAVEAAAEAAVEAAGGTAAAAAVEAAAAATVEAAAAAVEAAVAGEAAATVEAAAAAVEASAAAAVEASAAGETAVAGVGNTAAAVLGVSAVVGAVCGGVKGYQASEGADTAWEAAGIAAETVVNDAECVFDKANDFLKKMFQPKS